MTNKGFIVVAAAIAVLAVAVIGIGVAISGDDDPATETIESSTVSLSEPAPNFEGAPGPASPNEQEEMEEATTDAWNYEQVLEALQNPRTSPDAPFVPEPGGPGALSPKPEDPGGISSGSPPSSKQGEPGSRAGCKQPRLIAARPGYPYTRMCYSGSLNGWPAKTIGILFFREPNGEESQCTATVAGTTVNGEAGNDSVLVTAGHCVGLHAGESSTGEWQPFTHAFWAPSFRIQELLDGIASGELTFQEWFDTRAWLPAGYAGSDDPIPVAYVPRGWKAGNGWRWDFAAVVMREWNGTPIGVKLDSLGIDMGGRAAGRPIVSYGYPAGTPFDGTRLFVCRSTAKKGDLVYNGGKTVLGIGCDMSGGSSGGPWVWSEHIVSVNSYHAKDPSVRNLMFGPNLNGDHWKTFLAARKHEVY